MCHTSFKKSISDNRELLEIIHTDICGPFKSQSNGGSK